MTVLIWIGMKWLEVEVVNINWRLKHCPLLLPIPK